MSDDTTPYNDEDLVYVDPKQKAVLGRVEWSNKGNSKPKEMEETEEDAFEDKKEAKGKFKKRKRLCPWGTYKTMQKIYRIEGKEREIENYKTIDEAMDLAVKETFWD